MAWVLSAVPAFLLARPISGDLGWFAYGATAILLCFFFGLGFEAVLSLLRSGRGGFGILAAIAIVSMVVVIIVGYFIRRGENIPRWLNVALFWFLDTHCSPSRAIGLARKSGPGVKPGAPPYTP